MAWEDRPYYRDETSRRGRGMGGGTGLGLGLPIPTRLAGFLMITCLIVYLLQRGVVPGFQSINYWGALTYFNGLAFTQPWRWITYQYLHGSFGHLIWNVISIYFLVPIMESVWGWKRTFAFYSAGGIAAGVAYGVMCLAMGNQGFLIGASGSILALVGAIAAVSPKLQMLAMMVIPVSARGLALLYAVVYSLTVLTDKSMSDAAHLGGLVFGFVAPYFGGGIWRAQAERVAQWKRNRPARAREAEQESERDEQQTIDRILGKVHEKGMNSLSWSERRTLKRATERQRQADLARARRAR